MIEIKDINDKRIAYYKSLRYTPPSHSKDKLMLTEGEKVTLQLLNSDFHIHSIFAVQEFYKNNEEIISRKKLTGTQLFYAAKSFMNQIVGFRLHSGVMALANQPEPPELYNLSSPVIVMNGIINSENVGIIIRNCAAFGVDSIIVDKETSSPYLRRAVRVSMGAVLNMKVFFSENIIDVLEKLKKSSYKIISAEIESKSIPLTKYKFPSKFALVFGNEGKGIERDILNISDLIINIPITGNVNSLNVASSSAVILSKIYEQRNQNSSA
ncbi:MAG: RNA methyltransferase [Ignavibacteriae bacterium]|nr:RNA methyltransferase [Ignavibacteriota bacterium]